MYCRREKYSPHLRESKFNPEIKRVVKEVKSNEIMKFKPKMGKICIGVVIEPHSNL